MARESPAGSARDLDTESSDLPPELAEEGRLSGTAVVEATNAALLALSRAARAFLLYEPNNATIRHFIEDLRIKFKRALDQVGALDFEVRPFELALDGTVVYAENDRERSMAFRLFRDGVRRVRIASDVRWEEIQRLLEILSVRYSGVRQAEDDVVTLLRKAEFASIAIDVVEGFVPEEEEPEEPGSPAGERGAPAREVPDDWDLPARALGESQELGWRPVDEGRCRELVAEEADGRFAANAVLAVRALLDLRPEELESRSALTGLIPFVAEVRDFFLLEGHLPEMVQLVRTLYDTMRTAPEVCAPILRTFGERGVLRRLVHSVAHENLLPPGEMLEFLDLIPADHLTTVIEILGEDVDDAARRILRQLVERYAGDRADELLARLRSAPPRVASDLLRACARAFPERAVDAALELADHEDPSVVHEALRRFENAPPNPRVGRTLAELLARPQEDLRLRALDLMGRRSEHAAFSAIVENAERRAGGRLSTREAELIGRTLARLSPDSALEVFEGWLRPKGLVGRWVEGAAAARMVRWMAASGLGVLEGEGADTLLDELAEKSEGDLQRHARAVLERRHRREGGDG